MTKKTSKKEAVEPKREKRYRQFMYVQDLEHLQVRIDELKEILEKSGATECAFIIHDKDSKDVESEEISTGDTDGTEDSITSPEKGEVEKVLVRPHVHVALKFANPRTIASVAKLFKDKPQYVQVWRGRMENAYSYMLHRTNGARQKYQYSPESVVANFDFVERIKSIEKSVKASRSAVTEAIEKYASGELTYDQLLQEIGPVEVAKRQKMLENLSAVLEKKAFNEWLEAFDGKRCEVIWICGPAGSGKTTLAKKAFEKLDVKYTVLGSSRDPFQPYSCKASDGAGKNIILDDLRPNVISYDDLLRVLDPYQHRKLGPARYRDRYLTLEKVVVTTPYTPREFYDATKGLDSRIDTFEQLERRIFRTINLKK